MDEQQPKESYAGVWDRFCAGLITGVLGIAVILVVGLAYHDDPWTFHLVMPPAGVLYTLAVLVMLVRKGQSPGYWVLGMHLRPADGSPLALKHVLIREGFPLLLQALGAAATIQFLGALGADKVTAAANAAGAGIKPFLWQGDYDKSAVAVVLKFLSMAWSLGVAIPVFINQQKRAGHDLLAGTLVVRTKS
ncbi:MAG TPA: RDD family protein [bacterium]|jgi:uncharacterized RDD family membrane protein YckC|nr:RDD family protein [bacterium]